MKHLGKILGIGGTLAALTLNSSIYTINETEQAVVKQFGRPVAIVLGSENPGEQIFDNKLNEFNKYNSSLKNPISNENIHTGAGLYWKMPFIQTVYKVPNNLVLYDTPADRVQTKDKKTLEMDVFGPWKITNPLAYLDKLKSEESAVSRIDQIVDPIKSMIAGQYNLIEFVRNSNETDMTTSEKKTFEQIQKGREELMSTITNQTNLELSDLGVYMPEVRIKRADLPSENEGAIFNRMIAERKRIATQYRSEGKEEADKIKSSSNKEADIIKSEAEKKAEIIKGQGEAKATEIYANTYSQNPKFFELQRTLDNYPQAFAKGTTVILDPNNGFAKYLGNN